MRAPPASYSPMMGLRAFIAMSCSLVIFSAWVSDSEPPNTVKSLAKTKVLRPLTVPHPVTTPSPGTLVFSMPNSVERCSTNISNSSKLPLSSSSSMRSRAVSLPRACCASMRLSPPPNLAPARRSSRVSRMSFIGPRPYLAFRYGWVLTRRFHNRKPTFRHRGSPFFRGTRGTVVGGFEGASDERDGGDRDHRHRHRRGANAAAAGGADAARGNDGGLRGLGRIMVDLRHPVPGARSELRGLPRRPEVRRHRLQRRAQLPGADGAHDDGVH